MHVMLLHGQEILSIALLLAGVSCFHCLLDWSSYCYMQKEELAQQHPGTNTSSNQQRPEAEDIHTKQHGVSDSKPKHNRPTQKKPQP